MSLPSPDPVFTVTAFSKEFRDYSLEVDALDIPPGVVALLGETGSGKSTLMNAIGLLDSAHQGEIAYRGELLPRGVKAGDRIRRDEFSFAFQSSNLLRNLPVWMNVVLSRLLVGIHTPTNIVLSMLPVWLTRVFSRLVARVRVGPRSDAAVLSQLFDEVPEEHKRSSELSVGQAHRVAVGRALLKAQGGASVLVADEPTANVDRRTADQCFAALKEWQRRDPRNLLLFATHDLALAQRADYVILLGEKEKGVFHLHTAGPTSAVWDSVEELLVRAPPLAPPPHAPAPAHVGGLRRRGSVIAALLGYCRFDIFRLREAVDLAIRAFVVLAMFLIVAGGATFNDAAPRVAEKVFESDRLLRMVELESTGGFPINSEKLQQLGTISADDGLVRFGRGMLDGSRAVVAGVSPKRLMPLMFFRADGTLSPRWTDGVRRTYQGHPGLAGGDRLLEFWGLAPMLSSQEEVPAVVVSPTLLEGLGYDVEEFRSWAENHDSRASLYARERNYQVRLRVERVEEFPDQDVEVLVPTRLAEMVERLDPRVLVPAFAKAGYGSFPSRKLAEDHRLGIEEALTAHSGSEHGEFAVSIAPSLASGGRTYAVWVEADTPSGHGAEFWQALGAEIARSTGQVQGIEHGTQVIPGGSEYVGSETELTLDASMATMFVHEYDDIPRILDFLEEQSRDLHLRVLNAKNLEFVRTVQKTVSFGTTVVAIVKWVFLAVGLLVIAYSFVVPVHRKLGEIGILRAYGASRLFVLSRFILEIFGTCLVFGLVSFGAFGWGILPVVDGYALRTYPSIFSEELSLLSLPASAFTWAVGVVLAAAFVVSLVAWYHIRRTPADLLSMAR